MTSVAVGTPTIPIITIVACDSKNGIGSVTEEFIRPSAENPGPDMGMTDLAYIGMVKTHSSIPWKGKLPEDSTFFKTITSKVSKEGNLNACIMGKQSFFDIPPKFRKNFTNRIFVIITHHSDVFKQPLTGDNEGIEHLIAVSPDKGKEDQVLLKAIDTVKLLYAGRLEKIFLCGGESIYKLAAEQKLADSVFVTRITGNFGCNKVFPEVDTTAYESSDKQLLLDGFEFNKELTSTKSQIKYEFQYFIRKE